jgi:hypothetical protein
MISAAQKINSPSAKLAPLLAVFRERASARAMLVAGGPTSLQDAVDGMQEVAAAQGLLAELGQDKIQEILSAAFQIELPTECETLSPEEVAEEIERIIYVRACSAVEQLELADPRDRWRHTGEQQPRIEPAPTAPRPCRTAQSTIDAFFYVASLDNPEYLKRWLARHPDDAVTDRVPARRRAGQQHAGGAKYRQ